MALVWAGQIFVLEGYTQLKEKENLFTKPKNVRRQISLLTGVESICDETEVATVIEEKIKETMKKTNGWGENFEAWSSLRKYCKPGEVDEYPEGEEFELEIRYIRDWKMEKIMKKLDGNQFAILCKELGISAGEAVAKI